MLDDATRIEPATVQEWRAWLGDHADDCAGVWLVLGKRGGSGLGYEQAIETAVAFGWIDSRSKAIDDAHWAIWMTPRRPKSNWSQSNKQRVARLEARGEMTQRGRAVVDAAKADGSWG